MRRQCICEGWKLWCTFTASQTETVCVYDPRVDCSSLTLLGAKVLPFSLINLLMIRHSYATWVTLGYKNLISPQIQ